MARRTSSANSPNERGDARHNFGRARPSTTDGFRLHVDHTQEHRDTHYRELPAPTGKTPFRLDLKDLIPADEYAAILTAKKLVFHLNGDMGGISYAVPQELVAQGMESDVTAATSLSTKPAFLYLVGDCVYFNGQISSYYTQFYHPYEFYPAPIFAVPGNHDGENLPGDKTLDGFVRNFCAKKPVRMPESGDSGRTAMTQPNVYWTLVTPFAYIVGLYSNVPSGGDIRSPQKEWLVNELKSLPTDRPLFVALHHPIYSADDHHSGSTHMKKLLADATKAAGGRMPEMVLAGHVHNYQRMTQALAGGASLPHLVTGAGGYHNLHHIKKVDGQKLIAPTTFEDENKERVVLERYSDDNHGFLRLEVSEKLVTGRYFTVPRPHDSFSKGNRLLDYFEFDWKQRRYVPNHLS